MSPGPYWPCDEFESQTIEYLDGYMNQQTGVNRHRCGKYEAHTKTYLHYDGTDPYECAWDGSCITPHGDGYRGWYTPWSFNNHVLDNDYISFCATLDEESCESNLPSPSCFEIFSFGL